MDGRNLAPFSILSAVFYRHCFTIIGAIQGSTRFLSSRYHRTFVHASSLPPSMDQPQSSAERHGCDDLAACFNKLLAGVISSGIFCPSRGRIKGLV